MKNTEDITFKLAEKWRATVHEEFGDHIGLECYLPEDATGYKGDADIVVELTDLDTSGLPAPLPEQAVVDFVMDGMKADCPGLKFALDPIVPQRPV